MDAYEKRREKPGKRRKLRRRQKKQMAFLTLIILAASIVAIMLLTPGFDIKEINVHGNSVLKSEEIIRASGITKGVNIFGVSLRNARDNIKSMGYVDNVKIKRRLPSGIDITIEEEVGVAYIKAEEGYVIITADGRCIDITDGLSGNKDDSQQIASMPQLPIIRGLTNVKYKVGKIIKADNERQLEALFECLREFSKKEYVFDMREIDMTNLEDIRFYYKSMDLCVSLGSPEKIDYKLECFGPILDEIGHDAAGFIDLERLTYRKPAIETKQPVQAESETTDKKNPE